MMSLAFLIFAALFSGSYGFTRSKICCGVTRDVSTILFGIADWRDLPSGITFHGDNHDEAADALIYSTSTRRVPVIRITPDEAVLPGEKKYFQFHSDDELRLFQRALDLNHGIFALGAIIGEDEDGHDIMMNKLQLMEIKEYNMDVGNDLGIFCTAQAIGRAKLFTLLDDEVGTSVDGCNVIEEPLIAICEEHFDHQESYFSIEDANQMARNVLAIITDLSDKEQEQAEKGSNADHSVKILYGVDGHGQEEEEEEDCDNYEETRKNRFAHAFLDSLESDPNGYVTDCHAEERMLSWREMNAISWAAFCTSLDPSEDETFRLHALDQDRITDRLKLATYWLSDVVQEVGQESSSR